MDAQVALVPYYGDAVSDAGAVARWATPEGPIFVWGSSILYLASGREPAAAVVQLPYAEMMTEGLYARQAAELEKTRPVLLYLGYGHRKSKLRSV